MKYAKTKRGRVRMVPSRNHVQKMRDEKNARPMRRIGAKKAKRMPCKILVPDNCTGELVHVETID